MSDLSPREKRNARISALQAIYAQEMKGSDPDTTYRQMVNSGNNVKNEIEQYGKRLCSLSAKYATEVDALIQSRSKNWDISRITLMDKLILRMAITEMLYEDEVPPKVSIAEGVEIAKQFSTDDSSSFINGILDSIYNDRIKGKEKAI